MKKILLIAGILLTLSACNRNTVVVPCDNGAVRLQVISPEMVRVSISPDGKFHDRKSLVVLPQPGCKDFKVSEEAGKVVLSTSALTVEVTKADGTLQFFKADGSPLALDGRSSFEPLEVEGKKAWSTTVSYASTDDEAFYGLGQQQAGEFNHKGLREELYQYNIISLPETITTASSRATAFCSMPIP